MYNPNPDNEFIIFSKLPVDLINICISYTGKLNYRHGKYINKIDTYDERYIQLNKINRPKYYCTNNIICRICINMHFCSLQYTLDTISNVTKYCFVNNNRRTFKNYVLDVNNVWYEYVVYLM